MVPRGMAIAFTCQLLSWSIWYWMELLHTTQNSKCLQILVLTTSFYIVIISKRRPIWTILLSGLNRNRWSWTLTNPTTWYSTSVKTISSIPGCIWRIVYCSKSDKHVCLVWLSVIICLGMQTLLIWWKGVTKEWSFWKNYTNSLSQLKS